MGFNGIKPLNIRFLHVNKKRHEKKFFFMHNWTGGILPRNGQIQQDTPSFPPSGEHGSEPVVWVPFLAIFWSQWLDRYRWNPDEICESEACSLHAVVPVSLLSQGSGNVLLRCGANMAKRSHLWASIVEESSNSCGIFQEAMSEGTRV